MLVLVVLEKAASSVKKLGGEPVLGGTNLGKVGPWWVERFGFNEGSSCQHACIPRQLVWFLILCCFFNVDCIVSAFTGDNPASIVLLSSPGDAILSLGTSTTMLVSIPPAPTPPTCTTTSHILSHPTTVGGSMAMLCYKNGALTRDAVRDAYAHSSWDEFNSQVTSTKPGNDGLSAFYFPLREVRHSSPLLLRHFFFFTN